MQTARASGGFLQLARGVVVLLMVASAWGCKREEEFPHQLQGDSVQLLWLVDDTASVGAGVRKRAPEKVQAPGALTVEVRGEQLFLYVQESLAFRLQGLWSASLAEEGVSYYSVEECHFEVWSADGATCYTALRGEPRWGREGASARVERLDSQSSALDLSLVMGVRVRGELQGARPVILHFSSATH